VLSPDDRRLVIALTFRWHDDAAGRMDVPDWV